MPMATPSASLGASKALKVFALNAELYPDSANAWDSLAECHAALGDAEIAKALYAKAKALAKPSPKPCCRAEPMLGCSSLQSQETRAARDSRAWTRLYMDVAGGHTPPVGDVTPPNC